MSKKFLHCLRIQFPPNHYEEERIAEAENKVAEYENMFSSPDFFSQHGSDSAKLQAEFENAQKELASLYSRWEELEAKAAECQK